MSASCMAEIVEHALPRLWRRRVLPIMCKVIGRAGPVVASTEMGANG
jgi:hypothetical protein